MKVDAILPAGGRIMGEFAMAAGVEIKALITLDGSTLLERTLAALRATGSVERAVVIGSPELQEHPAVRSADAVLPEGASGIENLYHGIEWLRAHNGGQHAERVLVVTTDLPFLTPEAITGFLRRCPAESAVCLPVIERREFEARFPGTRSEFVRLSDGEWTLGCAFLLDPAAMLACRPHLDRVFEARKSQIGMARLLGLVFVLRWLTRRLTVAHIEMRCGQILGCAGAAVRGCAPELAFDIDLPEEYQFAMQHQAEGQGTA